MEIHNKEQDSTRNGTAPTNTSSLLSDLISREDVHATMEYRYNTELIKMIQAMKNKMESMNKKIDTRTSNDNKNRNNCKTPNDPHFTQRTSNIYC